MRRFASCKAKLLSALTVLAIARTVFDRLFYGAHQIILGAATGRNRCIPQMFYIMSLLLCYNDKVIPLNRET